MNFYNEYKDWIYIAVVFLAFFIFLGWNFKNQKTKAQDRKRTFKQRFKNRKNS